jgi:hypothetical protein
MATWSGFLAASEGPNTAWTLVGAATKALAIATNDGDTSGIWFSADNGNQDFYFNFAALPVLGAVSEVDVKAVARLYGQATDFLILINGTAYSVGVPGGSYVTKTKVATLQPDSNAWTDAHVRSYAYGVRGSGFNGSWGVPVTQMLIDVVGTVADDGGYIYLLSGLGPLVGAALGAADWVRLFRHLAARGARLSIDEQRDMIRAAQAWRRPAFAT